MKDLKFAFLSLMIAYSAFTSMAQSEENQITSELSVEVFDVVTRELLRDYEFWFVNEQDTLKMHIDSVDNMKIGLDDPNHYEVIVFKEGYDRLSVEYDNEIDSATVYLHFYLPKLKLSREEKRIANNHSRNLPPSIFDESPCFDKMKIGRKEILVMRLYVSSPNMLLSALDTKELRHY